MRHGLFRPGELESQAHVVNSNLRRPVRGILYRHRRELGELAARFNLTPAAVRLAFLLIILPRPRHRPLSVGLQVSAEDKAKLMRCSLRTVHNARELLQTRGLIRTHTHQRSVERITEHRKPSQRISSFPHYDANHVRHDHTVADMRAVDYPTPKLLTLFEAHNGQRSELHRPGGLRDSLLKTLEVRFERFDIASRGNCTPSNRSLAPPTEFRDQDRSRERLSCGERPSTGPPEESAARTISQRVATSAFPPTARTGGARPERTTGKEGGGADLGAELRRWAAAYTRRRAK